MSPLNHILSPITIKSMTLTNRVVMPPMGTNLGKDDGSVSPENLAYLKRRAQGQPGLIITEITAAHPGGIASPNQLGAYDDRFIPGLSRLVAVAHEAGSKIAMQIHHAGRESTFLLEQGKAVAPSPVPSIVFRKTPAGDDPGRHQRSYPGLRIGRGSGPAGRLRCGGDPWGSWLPADPISIGLIQSADRRIRRGHLKRTITICYRSH